MSVRPKPGCDGVWLVDASSEGRRCQTTLTGTHQEALDEEKRLIQGFQAQRDKNNSWSLGTAVEKVTEAIWDQQANSRMSKLNVAFAVKYFGSRCSLEDITTDRIDDYKTSLRRAGNANGTINRKLAALSRVLSFASERNKLAKVPTCPVRKSSRAVSGG